jgi:hypothetical protein
MSVRVTYSDGCNVDVRRVRARTARTVTEAVFAFARDGSGKIVAVNADDDEPSGFVRVYGSSGFAVVEVRADELYVHGIYSTVPLPQASPILDDGLPFPSEQDG